MANFRGENEDAEKSEEYPATPQGETEAEPNGQNDFQEKEGDKDSLPSYIETPAIDDNNHDNPLENNSEEENPTNRKR